MSGVPAPGASGETFESPFTDFLPLYVFAPAMNAKGDVAFGATTQRFSRSLSGLWVEEAGLLRSVAYGTAPVPGTGRNFAGYGIPTLTSAGDIVFSATIGERGSTDRALMLETAEGLARIVVEGESGFGSQLGQAIFSHIAVNDGGNIAFAGRVLVGFPSQQRLYKTTPSGLLEFAIIGGDAPVIGFPFLLDGLNNVQINDQGHVAFDGPLSNQSTGAGGVIFSGDPSDLRVVARSGDLPLGMPGGVTILGAGSSSLTRSGDVAFYALLTGTGVNDSNRTAVFAEVDGDLQLVARQGMAAPGVDGDAQFWSLASNDFLMNDSHQFALVALLTGNDVDTSNDSGVWGGDWDNLTLIAREGDPVPGADAGVRFADLAISNYAASMNTYGQVAMLMNVTGEGVSSANDLGIWATDVNGQLQLIVREGTLLEISPDVFKTVQEIGFADGSNNEDGLASGFNDLGQVGFAATFTDGTYGVFVSHLVAVPEPTGAACLMFALLSGLMIRRREPNQRSRL